ncbi:hypothetical protein D3C84_923960 [compost metagenome]
MPSSRLAWVRLPPLRCKASLSRLRSKASTASAKARPWALPPAPGFLNAGRPRAKRSATLRSSRTLPGQSWLIRFDRVWLSSSGTARSKRRDDCCRKCSNSCRMSSRRSRSGGSSRVTTLRR